MSTLRIDLSQLIDRSNSPYSDGEYTFYHSQQG